MGFTRGDIVYVADDPSDDAIGSEQWSGRYAVIVSCNVINLYSPNVIIAYTTTRHGVKYTSQFATNSTPESSTVMCECVRAVSKQRVQRCRMRLTKAEIQELDKALAVSMGLAGYWEEDGNGTTD